MNRQRHTAVAVMAGLALATAGCGAPTAQEVSTDGSRFRFEVPVEYGQIEFGIDPLTAQGVAYGTPGTDSADVPSDPVLVMTAGSGGEAASFRSLRELSTGGAFDPLDPGDDVDAGNLQILGYDEIITPEVWGVRLQLALGRAGTDFQALVDRRSDDITVSQLICTQACFNDHLDLIDEVQTSWRLEE
ncbi:MAG: hypothetical protein AAF547_10720 [Actinomycetota bacterium]